MKTIISTNQAPAAIGPYSQAVTNGQFTFISGQLGISPATGNLEEGIKAQTERALNNLEAILKEAGLSFDDIVKTTIFLTTMADFQTVNELYMSKFNGSYPSRSTIAVSALPKGGLVEIEAIAMRS